MLQAYTPCTGKWVEGSGEASFHLVSGSPKYGLLSVYNGPSTMERRELFLLDEIVEVGEAYIAEYKDREIKQVKR